MNAKEALRKAAKELTEMPQETFQTLLDKFRSPSQEEIDRWAPLEETVDHLYQIDQLRKEIEELVVQNIKLTGEVGRMRGYRDAARDLVRESLRFINVSPGAVNYYEKASNCIMEWEKEER